jgi:hypothetical protein
MMQLKGNQGKGKECVGVLEDEMMKEREKRAGKSKIYYIFQLHTGRIARIAEHVEKLRMIWALCGESRGT